MHSTTAVFIAFCALATSVIAAPVAIADDLSRIDARIFAVTEVDPPVGVDIDGRADASELVREDANIFIRDVVSDDSKRADASIFNIARAMGPE